jgi:hypothetical protein
MLLGLARRKHAFDHECPWDGCWIAQLCDALFDRASCETYLHEAWHLWMRKNVDEPAERLKLDKMHSAP